MREVGGERPSPISFLGGCLVSAVDSLGRMSVKEDHNYQNGVYHGDAVSGSGIIRTGAETAQSLQRNAEKVKANVRRLQKMSDLVMSHKLQFKMDDELDKVIVSVVDPNTEQVIKEIPSEDIQKLEIRIRKTMGLLFDELV